MFCQRCSYARTRRCCNNSTSNQISDTATGYIPVTMSYSFTPTGKPIQRFRLYRPKCPAFRAERRL